MPGRVVERGGGIATALHEAMIEAALAGAAAIMALYGGPVAVRLKDDASAVTAADEAAERAILSVLARRCPDIPVVAEEQAAGGGVPAFGPRFFLVDPLDGTKEFLGRNGEFTVNVGLVEAGEPVAGVVLAPVPGRLFFGAAGFGAGEAAVRDGSAGGWRPVAARAPAPDGWVAVVSRSHADARTDGFLAGLPVKQRLRAGSSLKFCLVAAGEADVYPRFGTTMEWDTAAGHAVLAGAGGCVLTPEGDPFVYGKPGYRNGFFVARGRSA